MYKKQKMSEKDIEKLGGVATKTLVIAIFAVLSVLVGAVLQKMMLLNNNYAFQTVSQEGFADKKGGLNLRYTSGEVSSIDAEAGVLVIKPNGTERTFQIDRNTMFREWGSEESEEPTASRTEENSAEEGTTTNLLPKGAYTSQTISPADLKEGTKVGVYTDSNLVGEENPRAVLVVTKSEQENMGQEESGMKNSSIAQVVSNTEKTSTLAKAVKAAGLVETLDGEQEFTVFAPTNSAFDNMSQSRLEALLQDRNQAQLKNILQDHVVEGAVTAEDLQNQQSVTTLNGTTLLVNSKGNTVTVGGIEVNEADIQASNGVIHTLNNVIQVN